MVTTLATGLCGGKSGALSVKDAVLQAKEKLGRARVDLSITYSTSEHDYQEVVAKLPDRVKRYPNLTAVPIADGLAGVGERVALLTSYLFGKGLKIVGGYSKWLLRSNNFNKDQKEKIRTICERNDEVRTLVSDILEEKYLADIKYGGA